MNKFGKFGKQVNTTQKEKKNKTGNGYISKKELEEF
jgi:hypothetical protein